MSSDAGITALGMVSEPPSLMDCDGDVVVEEPAVGSLPNRKNQAKVPKKIHKAEREKQKRDQLNELFLALGYALEPARQNSGKASVLSDATRLLRDLILQVESLRKENVALVTESHYVTAEKEELKDENTTLEADIARLQDELRERLQSDSIQPDRSTVTPSTPLPMAQPPVGSIYVAPIRQDLRDFQEPSTDPSQPKSPPRVMRPHARYPTPSDSWSLQVLSRNQHSRSSSSSSLNSREEGSGEA